MMRVALVALSGCWTGTAAPLPDRPPTKLDACDVRDADVDLNGVAELSIEGKSFARPDGPFARFEVAFRGTTAHANLENETFVLEGDLDLAQLSVRPRAQELRDGWIEIRTARARAATADALRFEVVLPAGLEPRTMLFSSPCRELTFASPPDPVEGDDALDEVTVPIGTPLRPKPDGAVIARVIGTPDPDSPTKKVGVSASVVEVRGAMSRLQIDGDNPVTAWASSTALQPPVVDRGGFGVGGIGSGRRSVSCGRDIPIFVRIGNRVIRVGRVKKDVAFYLRGDDNAAGIEVDLGLPDADLHAFFKPSQYHADCD